MAAITPSVKVLRRRLTAQAPDALDPLRSHGRRERDGHLCGESPGRVGREGSQHGPAGHRVQEEEPHALERGEPAGPYLDDDSRWTGVRGELESSPQWNAPPGAVPGPGVAQLARAAVAPEQDDLAAGGVVGDAHLRAGGRLLDLRGLGPPPVAPPRRPSQPPSRPQASLCSRSGPSFSLSWQTSPATTSLVNRRGEPREKPASDTFLSPVPVCLGRTWLQRADGRHHRVRLRPVSGRARR